jgi:nucleotide-binding universal stress UspA family protein
MTAIAETAIEVEAVRHGPIVLGTDFGPVSAAAEAAAIRAAADRHVDLIVVHAIDPGRLRLPGGRWHARVDQVRVARERQASDLVARARTSGVLAHVLIWTGDPASCVAEAARAEGAERIILGSHGRGRLGRAIAGSVAERVIDEADCPVDVVRPDAA